MDIDLDSLWVWQIWAVVGIAFAIGLLGGFARALRPGEPAPPKFHSTILGGVAAIAALYILAPETPLKLIAACIIAGYAGPSLLDSLETRFKLLVAQNQAAEAMKVGREALVVATDAAATARDALPQGQPLPGAALTEPMTQKIEELRGRLAQIEQGAVLMKSKEQ